MFVGAPGWTPGGRARTSFLGDNERDAIVRHRHGAVAGWARPAPRRRARLQAAAGGRGRRRSGRAGRGPSPKRRSRVGARARVLGYGPKPEDFITGEEIIFGTHDTPAAAKKKKGLPRQKLREGEAVDVESPTYSGCRDPVQRALYRVRSLSERDVGDLDPDINTPVVLTPVRGFLKRARIQSAPPGARESDEVFDDRVEQHGEDDYLAVAGVYAIIDGPGLLYGPPPSSPESEEEEEDDGDLESEGFHELRPEEVSEELREVADYFVEKDGILMAIRRAPLPHELGIPRRPSPQVHYIGASLHVARALRRHVLDFGDGVCAYARVCLVDPANVDRLRQLQREWIDEQEFIPPGNRTDETHQEQHRKWVSGSGPLEAAEEGVAVDEANESPAVADGDGHVVPAANTAEPTSSADGTPQNTLADNSGNGQAGEEQGAKAPGASEPFTPWEGAGDTPSACPGESEATSEPNIISPFARERDRPPTDASAASAAALPLDRENVRRVLEEVRPYLLADGGDLHVVEVDSATGNISVALQGACRSCPASSTTMKMGVERILRERFGDDRIGEVVALELDTVDGANGAETDLADQCEDCLDEIRPTLYAFGGMVEVLDVKTDGVRLRYRGPDTLRQSIDARLRQRLRGLKQVTFVETPT
ncbi:hypothetical protein CDCA_CDCA05G1489 [Cyanidium caldarium]|uniref:NIF system FeS cluster assembly NifU C-terminal domain-containing protein n=1 Tax=Cyanidium caldarium TaxID=2771 RepID=A0AAV9IT96_CYACA|nr:hypothetical protein CDCA_CDCA05G1489 [Cyanidium caldarium]